MNYSGALGIQSNNRNKKEADLMSKDANIEKWSSMDTITDHLGVSRETVLKWINNRNMPAHKVGRLWKFKISEVDDWIRSGEGADKKAGSE